MEREPLAERYQWERGKYPSPSQVLEASLAMIEPDGSVPGYDKEYNEWFYREPNRSVPLDKLPNADYEVHLLDVARAIMGGCMNVAREPADADLLLGNLAKYLTGYRHNQKFIQEAVSLVKVDEKGRLHPPHLPVIR